MNGHFMPPLTGCVLCSLLMLPVSSWAIESLSFNETRQLAVEQQPSVQAYQSAASAAREQAQTAAQLPNPQLKFGIINMPITGSDSLRLNRDDMTMSTIGLMQNMVRPVKRIAASAQLQAQAEVMTANSQNMTRLIQRDAALAWLDVFAAEKTVAMRQQLIDELHAERQVAATQLASGAVTATELLQQDAQLAMSHDQQLMAQRDARKARATLSRWLGDAATRPLAEDLPELSHTLAADEQKAVTQHPLVMAAEQSVAANRHEAELAAAEDLPDWSWEVMVGQRQGSRADMVSLQFTVGLPWQKQLRQRHQQAAALANTQQAEFLAEDQQRALRSEWADAQADYTTAEAREQEYIQRLIPATTAALTTAQAAYQVGKTPLSSVWQARRAVLAVELEHWLIRIDRLRALVRLQYIVGNEGVMQ